MKKLLLSSLLLSAFSAQANYKFNEKNISCSLPKDQVIKIGCTTNCGRFNRWALRSYAKKLGYKIKLYNLGYKKLPVDYTEVDAILIPGGVDINPKYYMTKVPAAKRAELEELKHLAKLTKTGKRRDALEFDILNKYFSNSAQRYQPILGICRGMQALTVSQGIPLYVDIKKQLGIKNRKYTLDKITVVKEEESLIKDLLRSNQFYGVELHHQALDLKYYNQHRSKWPHLGITAKSNKGKIVEAIEFYNRPVLGVQFHPEYTFGKARRGIFKWFLKRACYNKRYNMTKGMN